MTLRFLLVKSLVGVTAFFLMGCSPNVVHDADKAFVAQMIPHHRVGIELVENGQERSSDVRLRRLIFEMGAYHHEEVHQLERNAFEWGVDVAHNFPGNISRDNINQLKDQGARSYDIMWLSLMIEHHEGALEIAQELLTSGGRQRLRDMATQVVAVQADEIVEMVRLQKDLCEKSPAC